MRSRFSFWVKVFLAVALVALADVALFADAPEGLNVAVLLLGLIVAVALARPAVWRNRLGAAALAVAAVFAIVQIDRPSPLAVLLVLLGIGVGVLSPRARAGDDAGRWLLRLLASTRGLMGPALDLLAVNRVLKSRSRVGVSSLAVQAILPVLGGAVFLALFVTANPLLAQAFGNVAVPELDLGRLVFWSVIAAATWTALRPRGLRFKAKRTVTRLALGWPAVGVGSVTASLIVFNLLFALENVLDIAFLWSGAALPDGLTYAAYAHRGAYPLIVTALLAGLFVLAFLQPGTPTAQSKAVRRLVVVWIAQNLFLVASTMLRTADYIEAYSLTRLRIAALLWMALVAVGLVLICWRLLRGRSAGWLINANVLAAGMVLGVCAVVDLGAIAASWNTRPDRHEVDVDYLADLKGAGLLALARLEQEPLAADDCRRVHGARQATRRAIETAQADWRSWRWRDARRLARDARLKGACPLTSPPLTPTPKP